MKIKLRKHDAKMGFGLGGVLLSPFAKILSGILVAGLITSMGFGVVKAFEVKSLENKLLKSENEVVRLGGEVENCKGILKDQNKEILNIKLDAEADVERVNEVAKHLSVINKMQKKEIEDLGKVSAPKTCDESRDWLKSNLNTYEGGEE